MRKQVSYILLVISSVFLASCGGSSNIIEFNNYELVNKELTSNAAFYNAQLSLQENIKLGEEKEPSVMKVNFLNAKTTNDYTPEMFDSASLELSKVICTNLLDKERFGEIEIKYNFEKGIKVDLGSNKIEITELTFAFSCDTL